MFLGCPDGEDYHLLSEGLVIPPGSVSQCTSIGITNDNALEHTELFGFSLHLPPGSSENVVLSGEGEVTVISIYDDDGKGK